MKNITHKLIGFFAVVLLTATSTFAQSTAKPVEDFHEHYITVSSTEVYKEKLISEIIICYGPNHTKTVALGHYHKDNRIDNIEKLTNVLNELGKEGYEVISSSVAVTDHHQKKFFVLEKRD